MQVSRTVLQFLSPLLLAVGCATCAAAQTSDIANEFWPELDVYVNLNDASRLFVFFTATGREDLNAYADGQVGVNLDFWALPPIRKHLHQRADRSLSKLLMVRVGYLYAYPRNNSGSSVENMATGEATARAPLPAGLLLSERNRLDLRWLNGDPAHRYRNRLKLERTFDIGRFQLTPYAHAEVFYSFDVHDWTRLRYAAGAELSVTKRIILEGYYLRQNTWGSVPQFVNALGLAAQFYFR
jgi:hypothetical protein